MDHDDPQQPIAEPAPKSAGNLTANLWNSLAMTFLMVALGICVVTCAVPIPYAYEVSTPTKAAVDHCEHRGSQENASDMSCTGTWSLRGQSQTGPIKPPFRGDEQNAVRPGKSVLDVHVHDGTAYTASSMGKEFYLSLALGAGVFIWGWLLLWNAWRARR